MVRSTVDIAADIAAFQPTNGHWLGLDALLEELWHAAGGDPRDAACL